MEEWFVYVLKSLKNGRYYVGYTSNLERRLLEHNSGKTKGNKYYGPFELVYKEIHTSSTEARKREYYIKRQKSSRFIEGLVGRGVA
ncbi:MAG: GIY-YIG nuclease family protein [Candidatus Margulisbacteria bacterium]|nr:GIY-YIG nuclease family protein [Candidatus Margulisiibacteriota bacterium]